MLITNLVEVSMCENNEFLEDERDGRIGLMVMWADGSISAGRNATYLLFDLCGGWNPPTIPALRRELARRSGIPAPRSKEGDRRFLERLEAAGVITIFDVNRHFPELLFKRET
ncbi:MAG: hypothetical protein ACO3SP_07955 [Ilumatobacteraceae bacterium]